MSITGDRFNLPQPGVGPLSGPQTPQSPQEGPSVGTSLPASGTTSSRIPKRSPEEIKTRMAQGRANADAAKNLRKAEEMRGQNPAKMAGSNATFVRPRQNAAPQLASARSDTVSKGAPPPRPARPLLEAVKNGNVELVKELMKGKSVGVDLTLARQVAKDSGNSEMIKALDRPLPPGPSGANTPPSGQSTVPQKDAGDSYLKEIASGFDDIDWGQGLAPVVARDVAKPESHAPAKVPKSVDMDAELAAFDVVIGRAERKIPLPGETPHRGFMIDLSAAEPQESAHSIDLSTASGDEKKVASSDVKKSLAAFTGCSNDAERKEFLKSLSNEQKESLKNYVDSRVSELSLEARSEGRNSLSLGPLTEIVAAKAQLGKTLVSIDQERRLSSGGFGAVAGGGRPVSQGPVASAGKQEVEPIVMLESTIRKALSAKVSIESTKTDLANERLKPAEQQDQAKIRYMESFITKQSGVLETCLKEIADTYLPELADKAKDSQWVQVANKMVSPEFDTNWRDISNGLKTAQDAFSGLTSANVAVWGATINISGPAVDPRQLNETYTTLEKRDPDHAELYQTLRTETTALATVLNDAPGRVKTAFKKDDETKNYDVDHKQIAGMTPEQKNELQGGITEVKGKLISIRQQLESIKGYEDPLAKPFTTIDFTSVSNLGVANLINALDKNLRGLEKLETQLTTSPSSRRASVELGEASANLALGGVNSQTQAVDAKVVVRNAIEFSGYKSLDDKVAFLTQLKPSERLALRDHMETQLADFARNMNLGSSRQSSKVTDAKNEVFQQAALLSVIIGDNGSIDMNEVMSQKISSIRKDLSEASKEAKNFKSEILYLNEVVQRDEIDKAESSLKQLNYLLNNPPEILDEKDRAKIENGYKAEITQLEQMISQCEIRAQAALNLVNAMKDNKNYRLAKAQVDSYQGAGIVDALKQTLAQNVKETKEWSSSVGEMVQNFSSSASRSKTGLAGLQQSLDQSNQRLSQRRAVIEQGNIQPMFFSLYATAINELNNQRTSGDKGPLTKGDFSEVKQASANVIMAPLLAGNTFSKLKILPPFIEQFHEEVIKGQLLKLPGLSELKNGVIGSKQVTEQQQASNYQVFLKLASGNDELASSLNQQYTDLCKGLEGIALDPKAYINAANAFLKNLGWNPEAGTVNLK